MPFATRRSGGARSPPRSDPPTATSSSAWISSRSAGGRRTTTSSARGRPPALGARGRRGHEDGAGARGRLRRRLRDGARVAPPREPRRASSSRPWTPSGSRSCCSTGRAESGRRSCTSPSAFRSGSPGFARSACDVSMRRRSRPRPRFSRTASTRRRSSATGWRAYGESTHVEFVPFGVDEHAFVPSTGQAAVDVVSVGADPHRDVGLFLACGRRAAEPHVPTGQHGRSRARARSAAREPRGRGRHPVRRDAAPAAGGTCRRAARPREQLLGRDDGAPPGDGAREARRRHAHESDRDRVRARRRRELQARPARRRRAVRARGEGGSPRRVARPCARRRRQAHRRGRAHLDAVRRPDRAGSPRTRRSGATRDVARCSAGGEASDDARLPGACARRRDRLGSRRDRADLAVFHEFEAAAGRWRASVPAGARRRARAPRRSPSSTTGSPAVRPPASSTRSTSTSPGCGASRVRTVGWCTESTVRSAPTGDSTTGPTHGSPRSTPSWRTRPCSSPGTASRSTPSSASSFASGRHLEHGRPVDLPSTRPSASRSTAGRSA